jgi:uncharacterized protein YqjF (DUF2071 family)
MYPSLRQTDHRPWPLPPGRWTWRQQWCDLLFAHWPIPAETLRPLVPPLLEIQEFEGTSWVGVVPFRMRGVMRRPLPDVPWLSAFPELNLRLYVTCRGRPGVWFVSLDAGNPLAVWAARTFFHLPYFHADMNVESQGDGIRYRSVRRGSQRGVAFEATYRPTSPVNRAAPGSLEHFLTERYCLYAYTSRGGLFRTDVHHASWPLQAASADIMTNAIAGPQGIAIAGPPAHLQFSRHLDVIVWPAVRVA